MIRAVLFDYGHTLVDFTIAEDALREVYLDVRRLLVAHAANEVPEAPALFDAVTRRIGRLVNESYQRNELNELDILAEFEAAFAALGLRLPSDVVHDIAVMEHRALVSRLQTPPATLAVLEELREWGLRIGLVSNAHFLPGLMREDLERLGIAAYVDDAVFSSEIGLRKPHPSIYRKVLGALDAPPREAVFVGDRLRDDIGGAKSLGMYTVLTHQFRQEEVGAQTAQPDLVVQALPEILPYIRTLVGTTTDGEREAAQPWGP